MSPALGPEAFFTFVRGGGILGILKKCWKLTSEDAEILSFQRFLRKMSKTVCIFSRLPKMSKYVAISNFHFARGGDISRSQPV